MKSWRKTLKEGWLLFSLVHMLAYPLAFLWAFAAMPVLISMLDPFAMDMRETTLNLKFFAMRIPIAAEKLLWRTSMPAGLAIAIGNVLAVWVSVRPAERAKTCLIAFVVLFALGGFVGLVGWIRLLTMK